MKRENKEEGKPINEENTIKEEKKRRSTEKHWGKIKERSKMNQQESTERDKEERRD